MNVEQRLAVLIGQLHIANANLASQAEALAARVKELEEKHEPKPKKKSDKED